MQVCKGIGSYPLLCLNLLSIPRQHKRIFAKPETKVLKKSILINESFSQVL